LIALASMVLAATATRLFPHPPNMTSIAACGAVRGGLFQDRRLAFAVPLTALFLGDLVIGFHQRDARVYLSFALIVGVGLWLGGRRQPGAGRRGDLFSAVLFFVLTNFGVWAFGDMYPDRSGPRSLLHRRPALLRQHGGGRSVLRPAAVRRVRAAGAPVHGPAPAGSDGRLATA